MSKRNRKTRKPTTTGKKGDQVKIEGQLDDKHFKQNPNWYFKDAVQADVLSRIQMNAFGALTKLGDNIMPTVCAFYVNPCPGVTRFDIYKDWTEVPEPWDAQSKGVNRAAQKLWYMLTCKSGRAAGYTKADVAILILGMGAMIETYEFIRRAFGIAYTYNQRNRALPTMLYKAMGVDMADYQAHAADYLKRMNSLMAIMNQLPMPGNIAWFAKCQDIYQNIYMDYPSEMAQLFIMSPSTTWVLEENDGFIGGSYLRTVDMCVQHRDASSDQDITIGYNSSGTLDPVTSGWNCPDRTSTKRVRPLGEYIDVFEEQVNNLLFSSSFSQIYSDILRAFDNGSLSRWTFDYIDEKYVVAPVFDDNRLWMFHNATIAGGTLSMSRSAWQEVWPDNKDAFVFNNIFKYGTPLNDVYQWGPLDVVVYNPTIAIADQAISGINYGTPNDSGILDFPNDSPTVEERVEYTRYSFMGYDEWYLNPSYTEDVFCKIAGFNVDLPDHWFELAEILYGAEDSISPIADGMFINSAQLGNIYGDTNELIMTDGLAPSWSWSKFHHGTLLRDYNSLDGVDHLGEVLGELNAWAKVDRNWYSSINDMIYVDLFDIR